VNTIANFARSAALAAVYALTVVPAQAQSVADKYPEKPIRIIVPFAPGGSVDTLGRLLAQRMNENWGQSVLVENRPGAANMIGTQAVATAPPDGYTLLIAVSTHATNPALQAKVPYDGLKDFEPIALLARAPVVLFTHPSFPATDLKSLIEMGKAKTRTLNFGSGGVGTMTHLIGEMIKIEAGIDMLHIVYRGGTPAMNDLLAGHLPLSFATVAQAMQLYKAGQLKAIGISSANRYPSVPDIPTFKEQGLNVVASEWFGLLAPAGTPKPIIAKLNAEMKRIMALPNMGDRLAAIELMATTPEELAAFMKAETERWGALIRQQGLKATE
jgi:tripartite-type tricarboxylate transporter receptor subunit TctC